MIKLRRIVGSGPDQQTQICYVRAESVAVIEEHDGGAWVVMTDKSVIRTDMAVDEVVATLKAAGY
ncbi:hypothetical protein [Paramuribaculum intestinale]|uniref:hypothetical protein n=1 Tax=Paramuribaculum intestinale TaxID=2094151 RepID=UPI0032B0F690